MHGTTRHLPHAAPRATWLGLRCEESRMDTHEQIRIFKVVLNAIGIGMVFFFIFAFWAIVDAHLGS